jgi:demethylmenaquinone methyltransferase/2-methoxy-6-polyprenyl-1,4-benzoquinol methylase
MPKTPPQVWDDALLANPHAVADKRRRVQRMFAAIAPSYDVNNRLHSLWMDQSWRRRAVRLANVQPTDTVVDIACGTGDLALAFHRGGAATVLGIDFTFEMLPLAVGKSQAVRYINGDAQALPLPDVCCDVISIAFGIRNVADPSAALREFHRVLRPGGRLIVLEFALPTHPLLRGFYNFYFKQVLPRTATLISGDKTGAYRYLPRSVSTFLEPDQMAIMIRGAGFSDVLAHRMTFGICVCYGGIK